MKSIQVYFEDEEFEALNKVKETLTWREFILRLLEIQEETIGISSKYLEVENEVGR